MNAPQIIFIVLASIELLVHAHKHGQSRGKFNIGMALLNTAFTVGLLWWGGFFG